MSVKPPTGAGRVRLMEIAGGRSTCSPAAGPMSRNTAEIGPMRSPRSRTRAGRTAASSSRSPTRRGNPHALCPIPRRSSAPNGSPRISPTRKSGCVDMLVQAAGHHPDRAGGLRSRPHPGCGVLRHRRHRRARHQPAAHDPLGRAVRRKDGASSASAMTTGSSSMTASVCPRPVAHGGCCACSAIANVALLDGGLPKWRAEGRPLDDRRAEPAAAPFYRALRRRALVRDKAGAARQPRDPARAGRRRPRRRPLRRHRRGDPARPARRPHPGQPQPALRAADRPRAPGNCASAEALAALFARPASRSTARSWPAAARASPPARSPSPCI